MSDSESTKASMGYLQALELLIQRNHSGHLWRYQQLCAEDNPDAEQRDGYRALVVRLATDEPLPDITEHLRQAADQPIAIKAPCGSC